MVWMVFWTETGIGERGLRLAVTTISGDISRIKREGVALRVPGPELGMENGPVEMQGKNYSRIQKSEKTGAASH
jgi:hypothetical protein